MEIPFGGIICVLYAVCYVTVGITGARRFADNYLEKLFIKPKLWWLRYVLIAILAFGFAYIEFARLIITGILKVIQFMMRG